MEIKKTTVNRPPVMVIYGDHKIGKSTFAAGCPKAVFLPTEDGLQTLGVDAFPLCQSFAEVIAACEQIKTTDHGYKTLVLDSLDWTERLLWKEICEQKGWEQLGDGPYGAGYKLALNGWARLIKLLIEINVQKKMMIVMIAHSKIQKFEDPERDNYDRYDLDMHEKSANLICQYTDIIGFAATKVVTQSKTEGLSKSTKAKSTGERVLNLAKNAAYEAGNRYGLPEQVPLTWSALMTELKAKMTSQPTGDLAAVAEEKKAKDLEKLTKTKKTEKTEQTLQA